MSVATPQPIPVFQESLGGSLIDSARISVMAAMGLLPRNEMAEMIVLPGDLESDPTVHECLEQAMAWLEAARVKTIENAPVPPTSLHVVTSASKGGG